MAVAIYVFFPFGRWIDHAPLATCLIMGYLYLVYALHRSVYVRMILKGGWRRLDAVLMMAGAALLMVALAYYGEEF